MGNWVHVVIFIFNAFLLGITWFLASQKVTESKKKMQIAALYINDIAMQVFFIVVFFHGLLIFIENPVYELADSLAKKISSLPIHNGMLSAGILYSVSHVLMSLLFLMTTKNRHQQQPIPFIAMNGRLVVCCLYALGVFLLWDKVHPDMPKSAEGHFNKIRDLAPLGGAFLAYICGAFVWSFGQLPYEQTEIEQELLEIEEENPFSRNVVQDWYRNGAIESTKHCFDKRKATPPAAREDNDLTGIWKAVGGSGTAPEILPKLRKKIIERAQNIFDEVFQDYEESRQSGIVLIDSIPQPTESHFFAAIAMIGLEQGLRSFIVVNSDGEATDLQRYIVKAGNILCGSMNIGSVCKGIQECRSSLDVKKIPAICILQIDDVEQVIRTIWNQDYNSINSLLGLDVGLVLVSGLDTGRLQDLTTRIFTLKRFFAALHARGVDPLSIMTTESEKNAFALADHTVNGISRSEQYTFKPKSQGELRIWKVKQAFEEKENWPAKALQAISMRSNDRTISVTDMVGVVSTASIEVDGHKDSLHMKICMDGDASIAYLDERSFITSWRKLNNRASTNKEGHDALWGWDKTIVTNLFEKKNLKEWEREGKLPYPCPAYGRKNRTFVFRHLQELYGEGIITEYETNIFDPDISKLFQASVHRDGEPEYILRKDPKTKKYKRVSIIKSQIQKNDRMKREVEIRDVLGGGGTLFTSVEENIWTRYYEGFVFSQRSKDGSSIQRYVVDRHIVSQSRIEVQQLNENQGEHNEPILELIFNKVKRIDEFRELELIDSNQKFIVGTVEVEVTEKVYGYVGKENTVEYPSGPIQSTYISVSPVILFKNHENMKAEAFSHLAEVMDRAIMAYINAADEDIHVASFGLYDMLLTDPYNFPGIILLDRHYHGMGISELFRDNKLFVSLLTFCYELILLKTECPCVGFSGCPDCTPERLFWNYPPAFKNPPQYNFDAVLNLLFPV